MAQRLFFTMNQSFMKKEDVPFCSLNYGLDKAKLPIIPVEIKWKHLCFIIDTESTFSLIDNNVVEYFKDIVTPVGDYNISGIDGTKHKVDEVTLPFSFDG